MKPYFLILILIYSSVAFSQPRYKCNDGDFDCDGVIDTLIVADDKKSLTYIPSSTGIQKKMTISNTNNQDDDDEQTLDYFYQKKMVKNIFSIVEYPQTTDPEYSERTFKWDSNIKDFALYSHVFIFRDKHGEEGGDYYTDISYLNKKTYNYLKDKEQQDKVIQTNIKDYIECLSDDNYKLECAKTYLSSDIYLMLTIDYDINQITKIYQDYITQQGDLSFLNLDKILQRNNISINSIKSSREEKYKLIITELKNCEDIINQLSNKICLVNRSFILLDKLESK